MTGADVRNHPHLLFIKPAKRHLFRGQWLTALEIAELTGVSLRMVHKRLKAGREVDVPLKGGWKPKLYKFRGQLMSVADVVALTGLSRSTVTRRICGDIILEQHQIEPAYQRLEDWGDRIRIITFRGRSNSIAGWARETGICHATLAARLYAGWTVADALTRPIDHRCLSKTTTRNRRIIKRMTIGCRRARNNQIISRISSALRPQRREMA